MAAIALAAFISAFLCYQGFILVKTVPGGSVSWSYTVSEMKKGFDPGFNQIIFGLPLFLLYGSEFIFSFSRRPSRMIGSVAVINILLFVMFVLMG